MGMLTFSPSADREKMRNSTWELGSREVAARSEHWPQFYMSVSNVSSANEAT